MAPVPTGKMASVLAVLLSGWGACVNASGTCCSLLASALPSKVTYPGSSAYNASVTSYWAQQEQSMTPSCIVSPTSAQDVSAAIKVAVWKSCPFAVRNGGHASFTGASNLNGGVTIDMRGINSVILSNNNDLVTIGGGQTWHGVYSALSQVNKTLAGGRDANVGVAGSTLGGALGVVAPSEGFGCDSITEFEVVLASGRIVTANSECNSDLFRALKGGGSNFGIVTHMTFVTAPLGNFWAGQSAYLPSAIEDEIQAFCNFAANNTDNKADLLFTYHYSGGAAVLSNLYAYSTPVTNPAAFAEFYPIPGQLGNLTGVTDLPSFSVSQEQTSPDGLQQITFATTFSTSVKQMQDAWAIFNASIATVSSISGLSWSVTFEPIVPHLIEASNAKGGNMLGLSPPPEGLILTIASVSFSNAADYPYMYAQTQALLDNLIAAAKKNGVFNKFVELNHAMGSQKVFQSYGTDNYAFLVKTAAKYDPGRVFQTLMPGGFKL